MDQKQLQKTVLVLKRCPNTLSKTSLSKTEQKTIKVNGTDENAKETKVRANHLTCIVPAQPNANVQCYGWLAYRLEQL